MKAVITKRSERQAVLRRAKLLASQGDHAGTATLFALCGIQYLTPTVLN